MTKLRCRNNIDVDVEIGRGDRNRVSIHGELH